MTGKRREESRCHFGQETSEGVDRADQVIGGGKRVQMGIVLSGNIVESTVNISPTALHILSTDERRGIHITEFYALWRGDR